MFHRVDEIQLIQDGYEYQVLIMNVHNREYKVIVNYEGFTQHFAMWVSTDVNEAIDKAIEELHKSYPFEKLVFEYE